MKILVVSSCTKKKRFENKPGLSCKDFQSKEAKTKLAKGHSQFVCTVRNMYQGSQHQQLLKGVRSLEKFASVDLYVVSAGLGLVEQNELIPVYECTFHGMNPSEILERAAKLEIMSDFRELVQRTTYDLLYLALGADYLRAIGDWEKALNSLTIAFRPTKHKQVVVVPANADMVVKLGSLGYKIHGTSGFKGNFFDLFVRKIVQAKRPKEKLAVVLQNKVSLKKFIFDEVIAPANEGLEQYLDQ